ncbi:aminoglycoside phosphotransferase family protein [Dactylosporangium sp. NPDC051485]|uniref:phosphotransferase family protein n=1 Tax=Dactylosporangium sp. NPDC051485 TaxID=3154846 RepID=UPI00342226FB
MEFRPISRLAGAFQETVTADDLTAICARVFGLKSRPLTATELGTGQYNTTYRVQLDGHADPVVVRVAPEPGKQFRSEWQLMRNEYASLPWLAPLAPLMPSVIAADWSHELIGRDYLVQTFLPGVPAPDHLSNYPRPAWAGFFQQLGEIARAVHGIRGPHFGPVNGPGAPTWSTALVAGFDDIAADVEAAGLDAADLRKVSAVVVARRSVFDEVEQARMLAGDLWTVNVMLDRDAPVPTITGVLDLDRTWWGDPAADWTIRMASAKPGTERDAFWDSYGSLDRSIAAQLRARVYEARHLGAVRLERHRLGNIEGVESTYRDLEALLADLS